MTAAAEAVAVTAAAAEATAAIESYFIDLSLKLLISFSALCFLDFLGSVHQNRLCVHSTSRLTLLVTFHESHVMINVQWQ